MPLGSPRFFRPGLTFVKAGVVGPIGIDGASLGGQSTKDRKGDVARLGQKVYPQPDIGAGRAGGPQDRQKVVDGEIVVDKPDAGRPQTHSMTDIGQGLCQVLHVNHRCDHRAGTFEQTMKSAAVHGHLLGLQD